MQQFLLLVFSKEMVNPGWVAIKNRSAIKKAVICGLEIDERVFEDLIQSKRLGFLSGFYAKSNVAVFNRLFCEVSPYKLQLKPYF